MSDKTMDWDTWEGRINWVTSHRETTAAGHKMSETRWSLDAGLTRSHVWQIKSGHAGDPGTATTKKLAWAAQVSFRWLAGSPGADPNDRDDIPTEPVASALVTYADLPGWASEAEEARRIWPDLDVAIEALGEREAPEIPGGLTSAWIGHHARVILGELPQPPVEERERIEEQAAKKRDARGRKSGAHQTVPARRESGKGAPHR